MAERNPTGDETSRAGLCADCRHVRRVDSPHGSRFYLCERSFSDARFVRYPRLPVLHCPGYEPHEQASRRATRE